MLKNDPTPEQVMAAVIAKAEATPLFVTGIPGYVQAALVAPDCVLVCDERFGVPFTFCLN